MLRFVVHSTVALLLVVSTLDAVPKSTKFNAAATKALLAAAGEGAADPMLAAIADGADPNGRDEDKNTPLILAVTNQLWGKEKEVVATLVKAGASLETANKDGMTPLMAAATTKRSENAAALLEAGAKVATKDQDGWTALSYASNSGDWSSAEKLIAAKSPLETADTNGWTPMLIALNRGHSSVAEKLAKAGAKIPPRGAGGTPLLLLATFGRDVECLRMVLDTKPDLNGPRDKDGWPAIEVAASMGDAQLVMELLRAGADPAIKDPEGKTALDRALESENREVIAILGGTWDRNLPAEGAKMSLQCPAVGGAVEAFVTLEDSNLVFTTAYPKPVSWYLGGGLTNRAKSATKYTYDGSIAPAFYLDTDGNARTGANEEWNKASKGSEYAVDYSEYMTSVTLTFADANGNERQRQVTANVLDVDVEKNGESVDIPYEQAPIAAHSDGILRTAVPLSALNLKRGKNIRVTAKIGSCEPVTTNVKLK